MRKINKKQGYVIVIAAVQILLIAFGIFKCCHGGYQNVYQAQRLPSEESSISLGRGSYDVVIGYDEKEAGKYCDAIWSTPYGQQKSEKALLTEDVQVSFEIMLPTDVYGFHIRFYDGDDIVDASAQSITVNKNRNYVSVCLFLMICAFAVFDIVALFWNNGKKKCLAQSFLILLGCAFAASVPLLVNYVFYEHDMIFHMMRIEGMAEALKQGQFPVRVQPLWLNGYGYAVSVLYGDLLLYIPAFLRVVGFPLQTAYQIYMFLINFLTVFCGYYCVKEISGNKRIGFAGGFLYVLAANRITSVYYRCALGEVTAYAFYPLVFLGLYYFIKKNNRKSFWLLVIGFTGILQSHLLSFEMVLVFAALYCLLNVKKAIANLPFLLKTALVTIFVNLNFLVPMLDYLLSYNLRVESTDIYAMQEQGLFVSQMFNLFGENGTGSSPVLNGAGPDMPLGVGYAFVLVAALAVFELVCQRTEIQKKSGGTALLLEQTQILVLMLVAMCMTCYFFPWNTIRKIPVIGTWLTPYQFAWRFSGMAAVFGIILFGYVMRGMALATAENKSYLIAAGVIICGIAFISAQSIMENKYLNVQPVYISDGAAFDTIDAGSNMEYLFDETEIDTLRTSDVTTEDEVTIAEWGRDGGILYVKCQNKSGDDASITVPILNYKQYAAYDGVTGEKLETSENEEHILTVILPEHYDGTVFVTYKEPWYWRIAELVSVCTVAGCLWLAGVRRRKAGGTIPENKERLS